MTNWYVYRCRENSFRFSGLEKANLRHFKSMIHHSADASSFLNNDILTIQCERAPESVFWCALHLQLTSRTFAARSVNENVRLDEHRSCSSLKYELKKSYEVSCWWLGALVESCGTVPLLVPTAVPHWATHRHNGSLQGGLSIQEIQTVLLSASFSRSQSTNIGWSGTPTHTATSSQIGRHR